MKDRSRRADGSYLASHGRWYGVGPRLRARVHKSASFFTSSVAAVMHRGGIRLLMLLTLRP